MVTDPLELSVAEWKDEKDAKRRSEILVRSIRPHIQNMMYREMNKYRSANISEAQLSIEAEKILIQALDTYDASKGATFPTHLFTALKRLSRPVINAANFTSMPEDRAQDVGLFQNALASYRDQGIPNPSTAQLAQTLGWPTKRIDRIQRELRHDIASTTLARHQTIANDDMRRQSAIANLPPYLSPDEKIVFDLFYKQGIQSGNDIAKKTGFSASKVTNLKNSIGTKISNIENGRHPNGTGKK